MYEILATNCWLQAAIALAVDKDLALLFGQKALVYDRMSRLGELSELAVTELDLLQIKIDARLKFREECN